MKQENYSVPEAFGYQSNHNVAVHIIMRRHTDDDGTGLEDRDVSFILGEGSEQCVPRVVERALRRFKRDETSRLIVTPRQCHRTPGVMVSDVDTDEMTIVYDVTLKDFTRTKAHWELTESERLEAAETWKLRGTDFFKAEKYRLAKKNYKKVLLYIQHIDPVNTAPVTDPLTNRSTAGVGTSSNHASSDSPTSRLSAAEHNEESSRSESDRDCEMVGSDIAADAYSKVEALNDGSKRRTLLLAAHLNLALSYLKLGSNLKALDQCDRALEICPTSDKGLYRRGLAHLAMDSFEEAINDFNSVLIIDSHNVTAQQQLNIARTRLAEYKSRERVTYAGMFDKFASCDASKAAALDSNREDVFSNVGEWSNELAKDMMTLEQEMAAFGEVMPQPRYNASNHASGNNGIIDENDQGDSDSD